MKKNLILMLWPVVSMAGQLAPTPLPIFLKAGFSSVLEFDEAPTRVVLGNGQSFQVEKTDRSLVIRALASYAATNMFVYFKDEDPRLFILSASEDANPTYYKKFEKEVSPRLPEKAASHVVAKSLSKVIKKVEPQAGYVVRILRTEFDTKKDYLTLECDLESQSKEVLKPVWNLVRLTYKTSAITPYKLWAERQEVQKDSHVKFRVIFAKPNLPRDLKAVALVLPLLGQPTAINVSLQKE